ncbi:MAG: hemin uptake protein HemP [Candidatus Binatia bacterium]
METQNKLAANEFMMKPTTEPSAERKRRIDSAALFRDRKDIVIIHEQEEYNLRITRNGKLILTK